MSKSAAPKPAHKAESSPRSKRAAGSPPKRTLLFAVIAFVVVVVSILTVFLVVLPHRSKGGTGKWVEFTVSEGAADEKTIEALVEAGILDGSSYFSLYSRMHGGIKARPGKHLLSDNLAPVELLRRLRGEPEVMRTKVTIPEGFSRFDVARRLKEKGVCDDTAFLAASADPALLSELGLKVTAEGYLFPATYDLGFDSDPKQVVRRLVKEGRGRIDKLVFELGLGAVATSTSRPLTS